MDILLVKLVLTPALIGTASLAGRRWGAAVSGWLVGIPFTSAPIALFLALGQGPVFAATAAVGTMAGAISQAAFCIAYSHVGGRFGSAPGVGAGTLAFALSTAVLQHTTLGLLPLVVLVIAALCAALLLMPRRQSQARGSARIVPAWDLPARMVVATVFVLLLTGVAPALGPRLSGLLAPFPLYAVVLAVFSHRLDGSASAIEVLRGLLVGLFAFAGFFLAVAMLIERAGIAAAFAAGAAVIAVIQAVSLWALRRAQTRIAPTG